MNGNIFPLPFSAHLIFAVVAFVFFLIQFIRVRYKYQLVMAVAGRYDYAYIFKGYKALVLWNRHTRIRLANHRSCCRQFPRKKEEESLKLRFPLENATENKKRSKMKICILDWTTVTSGDIDYSVFREFGEVRCYPITDNAKAAEYIADSDMVLCNKVMITQDVINKCPNIKYIGLFANGL